MELNSDWREFQTIFYPGRRLSPLSGAPRNSLNQPVYLIHDQQTVIAAFCEGDDLSQCLGASLADVDDQLGHREIVTLERAQVDSWMEEAIRSPRFYEQVKQLREKTKSGKRSRGRNLVIPKHFLIEALEGWWRKLLPPSFGLLIRLEGPAQERDFLVFIRKGVIEGFHQPDLNSLSPERRRQDEDVIKYLSEKHLIPVKGVFARYGDWYQWMNSVDPWRDLHRALKAKEARLHPWSWELRTMIAVRAVLGI